MSKLSRFFTILFVIAVLFTAVPAYAKGSDSGSGSYSYDDTYGAYRYVGSTSWTWHKTTTPKGEIWNLTYQGSWKTYYKGALQASGTWSERSHQKVVNGQLMQYHGTSKGTDGANHDYRYTSVVVNGTLKVTHYWFDGKKMY